MSFVKTHVFKSFESYGETDAHKLKYVTFFPMNTYAFQMHLFLYLAGKINTIGFIDSFLEKMYLIV